MDKFFGESGGVGVGRAQLTKTDTGRNRKSEDLKIENPHADFKNCVIKNFF